MWRHGVQFIVQDGRAVLSKMILVLGITSAHIHVAHPWRQFVHDIISAGEVPRSQTEFVVNRRSTFASFESYFLRPRAWLARSIARVISTSDKFPDEFEPTEENLPHDEPT